MFGINGTEAIVLLIVAALVIGPERLPQYAQKFAHLLASLRSLTDQAKKQLKEDIGDEIDWEKADPRQYDPRSIIKDAFTQDVGADSLRRGLAGPYEDSRPIIFRKTVVTAGLAVPEGDRRTDSAQHAGTSQTPFDPEAT